MTDPFSDRYWIEEFQVTRADLDRIAAHIRETGQVYDLTALARRVVRGRLRHGPETSAPAQSAWAEDPSVRLWDPAGKWKESDQTIVWTWSYRAKRDEVMIGEITCVDPTFARVAVDDVYQPVRKFTRAAAGSSDAIAWHQKVRKAVEVGDLPAHTVPLQLPVHSLISRRTASNNRSNCSSTLLARAMRRTASRSNSPHCIIRTDRASRRCLSD